MKRLISVFVVTVVLLCFGGCDMFGNSDVEETIQTTSKRNVIITKSEVEKQVNNGNIKGANFALGTKIDEIKEYYLNIIGTNAIPEQSSEVKTNKKGKPVKTSPTTEPTMVTAIGQNDEYYQYVKGQNFTSVWYNGEKYFFTNSNVDLGVAIIVCNESGFGFNIGNCPSIDVVNSLGEPDVKDIPDSSQLFFCLGSPVNPTRYTYNFGKNRLDFIFSDDNLLVVTLTDTNIYGGFVTGESLTAETASSTTEKK